jgi:GNAT superfamily N-acetyltransferase
MENDALVYLTVNDDQIELCRDLCNNLMAFQASKASIGRERLAAMTFENRMVPSVRDASDNHIVVVMAGNHPVAYAYSSISRTNKFPPGFLEPAAVVKSHIGLINNFFIEEEFRSFGIGSRLFDGSVNWLRAYPDVDDIFVFVSNGNDEAREFYKRKGFEFSHLVMDGFITALRA